MYRFVYMTLIIYSNPKVYLTLLTYVACLLISRYLRSFVRSFSFNRRELLYFRRSSMESSHGIFPRGFRVQRVKFCGQCFFIPRFYRVFNQEESKSYLSTCLKLCQISNRFLSVTKSNLFISQLFITLARLHKLLK